ncbi:glutathione S-transferase family protein [Azospirillum sp. RWY-5-1]|uniref:Glutathione S-transferase family protein n=1 Tax=Azospirillum oleiclasticum TaxID=2735135 RepID=A0ABX2TLK0_9PROT|nr:glutathione S-transferase family protein [Azospirillum oleiclasticum]NYZ16341.1 glutathione S-transferase family protein [Azospirillum oleiclasticum]NYZ23943.1 glutathione S-transferase family protein [Azospirillum oleiclasticum]
MEPTLFGHPFAAYCQKVLIAFYEAEAPFRFRVLTDPDTAAEFRSLWPVQRMPILIEDGRTLMESTVIIEHLALTRPAARPLLPADPHDALAVRTMDRIFDNYIMTPMQAIVFDRLREEGNRDPYGVAQARRLLDTTYAWLDDTLAGKSWAAGEGFSLADCAAAPSLFYADWVHPIDPGLERLRGYRQRLLERSSFAHVVDEARPYRTLFPGGAPDRD